MNDYLTIKLGKKTVIGIQSIFLKKRSEFLYKALIDMDCYALRKHKLHHIFDKYNEMSSKIKDKIAKNYHTYIRTPVFHHKERTIKMLKKVNNFSYSLNFGEDSGKYLKN